MLTFHSLESELAEPDRIAPCSWKGPQRAKHLTDKVLLPLDTAHPSQGQLGVVAHCTPGLWQPPCAHFE